MTADLSPLSGFPHLHATADYIVKLQRPNGAIPWFDGGITDPWDHIEALMGLTVHGHWRGAEAGLQWLAERQRADGAWYAAYNDEGVADDSRAETNFVAYVATGLWHYFLITGQRDVLQKFWLMVDRAMAFVLRQQADGGQIYWAVDTHQGANKDALITGCSSIYKSLECALNIATELHEERGAWRSARQRLGNAIRNHPELFDRTWGSKARYSMDWFYPVLGGVVTQDVARQRLLKRWDTFVKRGFGCRCVADQPWVTVAESCELVMACVAADLPNHARQVFDDIAQHQLADGSWWTGYVFNEGVYWPDERPTWTAAAVLLAADALHDLTPGSRLFTSVSNTL
ncbi:MAG: prenyltransferase [Gammaproteobacteria bacterium]|nr:prenyltransferase [Gammaproteobacteria bacterium]